MNPLLDKLSSIIVPKTTSLEIECRFYIDERKKDEFQTKMYTIESTIEIAKKLINKYAKYKKSITQTINFIAKEKIKQLVFINGEQQKDKLTHYSKTKIINPVILLHNILPACKLSANFETPIDEFSISEATMARIRLRYTIDLDDWKLDISLIKTINDFSNPAIIKSTKNTMFYPITVDTFIEKAPWYLSDIIEIELEYTGKQSEFGIKKLSIINDVFDDIIEYNSTLSKNNESRHSANQDVRRLADSRNADSRADSRADNRNADSRADNRNADSRNSADSRANSRADSHADHSASQATNSASRDVSQTSYQNTIYEIAKLVRKDAYKFKHAEGIKQLSNQVIELDKNMFLKDVLSSITQYYITDKVDGKRTLIYIGTNTDDSYAVNNVATKIDMKSNTGILVFDSEYYEDTYYVFDMLVNNGVSITNLPFSKRYEIFEKVVNQLGTPLKLKPFIKLTDKFQDQIKKFKSSKKPYEVDGIILTPEDGKYDTMTVYKYKPIDRLTIDFLIKKCPDKLLGIIPYIVKQDKTLYLLFSGISSNAFKKLNMSFIKHYEDIFPGIETNITRLPRYFPIQFQASNKTFGYIFYSDNKQLDNEIGEFGYNTKKSEWVLHNIREDRRVELARGNYFGNNYKVAEMTWLSYETPLIIEDLDIYQTATYFQEHDNILQKASRNFNSYVKSEIVGQFKNTKWLMDLASGKGQDLFRYASHGIKNAVFLEIDNIALQELIFRKHEFSKNDSEGSMSIYTHQLDLNHKYKENIETLSDIAISQASIDIIMCHFAFHYLIKDNKSLQNIIKFIAYWLKPGGRFIFTAFDGKEIIKLLNENNGEWTIKSNNDIKYSIKKQYKTNFVENIGQQIDVLLPFSKNKYYSEYLVNIDYISHEFDKAGLTLEIDQSFGEYLPQYKVSNKSGFISMDENDKTYSSLYHYYCFYKKSSGGSTIKRQGNRVR